MKYFAQIGKVRENQFSFWDKQEMQKLFLNIIYLFTTYLCIIQKMSIRQSAHSINQVDSPNKNSSLFNKLFQLNSKTIIIILIMMMISTTFGLRINHQQQPKLQRIFSSQDQTFKFRIFCPYSFLERSKTLITQNSALNEEQKAILLGDTYQTTLRVRDGHEKYNYNTTYLVQVRSIATLGPNDTVNNHLYYCGIARNFYGTCQKDVKFSCSSPGSMFDVWTYQHIDVAFVNILDPMVVPNPWQVNHHVGAPDDKIKLCFDPTLDDQVCEIYEKTNPLETFSDPIGMHNHSTSSKTEKHDDQENESFIKIRLNPNNWPISTHIHGLQIRPTMDGHPQSWVSNVGQRGPGAFSSQDECYYSSFDKKQSYTQKMKANGSPPPVMIIKDAKGFDITSVAKINRYPNAQSPGNLWYHDHAMRLTNYNAISGLAGYYILRSIETEKQINVPRENEIFLLISSAASWKNLAKSKFRGGQVYRFRFLNDLPDSEYNISFTHRSCSINTPQSKIKFTMTGTDASLFHEGIEGLTSFTISSGQRLELLIKLNDNFTNFDLCSQQKQGHNDEQLPPDVDRIDQIKDQLKHPQDYNHVLQKPVVGQIFSNTVTMAEPRPENQPYTGRVTIDNIKLSVPYTDLSLVPQEKIVTKKMRSLNYLYRSHNLFGIHGRSDFHKGWTQQPQIGTIEDYFFINLSNVPHPLHFHLVMFQVLKEYELRTYMPPPGGDSFDKCALYEIDTLVQAFKSLLKTETKVNRILKFHLGRVFRHKMQIINYDYICYNRKYFYEQQTVTKHLNLIFPENSPPNPKTNVHGIDVFAKANANDVVNSKGIFNLTLGSYKYISNDVSGKIKPEHSRWKDTVFLKAPKVYQFRVRWTKNDYEEGLTPKDTYFSIPLDQLRQYPGFVYHCHIIHHEDYEMMRPVMLKLPKNLTPNQCINKETPCNFNSTTNKFNLKWSDKYQCINKRCNV